MKALPTLLFLIYIKDATSQIPGPKQHYYHSGVLPKKNMQILISRKFLKVKPTVLTKKPSLQHDGYTVFPAVASMEKMLYHVPPSQYFPVDGQFNSQKRIKKVLDDYTVKKVRAKRSAHGAEPETKNSKKRENVAKGKEETKRDIRRNTTKRSKKGKIINRQPNGTKYTDIPKQTLTAKHFKDEIRQTRDKTSKKGFKERPIADVSTITDKIKERLSTRPRLFKHKGSKNDSKPYKRTRVHRNRLRKRKGLWSHNKTKLGRSRDKHSRRLIAARDAMIEDFPYVVSIQKNGEHWCAGALISPVLVITTANCLWKSNRLSRLRVRVGSQHADRGGKVVKIQEVMKHPSWSIRSHPDNDVALVLLSERILFTNKLHAVDLPNRIMMPAFEDAWVTSWGAERRDGVIDKKSVSLQMYHARLMDRKKCNNVTGRFGVLVTNNFICLTQVGRRAPCTRDTGAPAVSDGVVWGLASWGIRKPCGTERFPAMFSYLASQTNMDFISNATRYMMSNERHNPFLDRYPTEAWTERTETEYPVHLGYVSVKQF